MDVVPSRHQGHQDQSEAEREVPALDELGQYGREVDQFCATEHDVVEQKNEDDVLLPYESITPVTRWVVMENVVTTHIPAHHQNQIR
ncbi:hypothetical protein PAHAL_6G247500 [Panicum hallii]|uniref:Uncharacterized protein n=1 Tax=Panicum hallii TaxID=206008 RepID=A0A2T8IHL1_9POAL|nr:hypothetical protein PAHAL_6G247500 [Panicum hallii]